MSKSPKKDNQKKRRGRPATGVDPLVGVRMSKQLQAEIRAWAERYADKPKLATAVRRLVEIGLASAVEAKKPSPPGRSSTKTRAKEMASAQIDRLVDQTASTEEQVTRKRRLLKGPSEFAEDRRDQPTKNEAPVERGAFPPRRRRKSY